MQTHDSQVHDPDPQARHEDIWKRIKDVRFAMLTTIDADGSLSSRPMTTVQKELAGTMWFFLAHS